MLPDGTEIAHRYDEAGRLVSVGHHEATATASYDDTGRVVSLALPGGVTAAYGYDQRGLPAEISYRNAHGGQLGTRHDPGNRLVHHQGTSLRYDPAGNLLTDGGGRRVGR